MLRPPLADRCARACATAIILACLATDANADPRGRGTPCPVGPAPCCLRTPGSLLIATTFGDAACGFPGCRTGFCGFGRHPSYFGAYYGFPGYYIDNGSDAPAYPPAVPPAAAPAPEAGVVIPPAAAPAPVAPARDVAEIDLTVPAGAVIWFQGIKVKQTGAVRYLVTPPLSAGQSYTYEVRATYTEGGRDVTAVRNLSVRGGDRVEALFLALPLTPTATARAER
jgi:uncharacterized protein (TIGR03000 family)